MTEKNDEMNVGKEEKKLENSEEKKEEPKEKNNSEKKFEEKKKMFNEKKDELVEKARENPWMVASVVLGILLIGVFFTGSNFTGGVITGSAIAGENAISLKVAQEKFEEFAKSKGVDIEVLNIELNNGLYEISFSSEGGDSTIYLTLDGENLINGLIPLTITDSQSSSTQVPKSDIPTAELFIMTHCPYGTQAEKGFIPVMKLLEGVADLQIRFVHYFMHEPEETETPIQVCIREEQGDKFLDYLTCFLEGDGNSEGGYIRNGNDPSACMARVGVDESKVTECVDSTRWETYYGIDSELSQKYGVRGSPTLVINGVQANSGRDSESYLNAICETFSDVPEEECMTEMSSASPSVYFGWDGESPSAGSGNVCG